MSKAIKVVGLKGAIKAIDSYGNETFDKLEAVTRAHTERLESNATSKVPVRSGKLKSSIKSEVERGKDWVFGRVGASAPHAHLVEFGTVKTGANPFLRPSFEIERRDYFEDVKKVFEG